MLASNVSLGSLRLQAQQRADLENSQAISIPEWNQYLSQSYKRLYDMLVAAYGNDYSVALPFQFNTGGSDVYPLPDGTMTTIGGSSPAAALYKLLAVYLMYSGSPNGFVSLMRFEEIDRNKFGFQNTATNFLNNTNLKYRISGKNIEFNCIPTAGQLIQLKYIPKPTSLQFLPIVSTVFNSAVVNTADTSDLLVGMSVYGPAVVPGTVITIINSSTQITLSIPVQATNPVVNLAFWIDSTSIDGISGWEEYVIIDAAIKAKIKQEQPVDDLRIQKDEMVADIQGMSEGRDAGQAHHTSDVMSLGGDGYGGNGGYGDGWGGY